MLAAIGHDLRTPITSLRLRAEFVDDEERDKMLISTLDEMQAMTEATLAFARDDADAGGDAHVDLAALIESVCARPRRPGPGREIPQWRARSPYRCRPDALRRARAT